MSRGCRTRACGLVLAHLDEVLGALEGLAEREEAWRLLRERSPGVFLLVAAVLASGAAVVDAVLAGQQRRGPARPEEWPW